MISSPDATWEDATYQGDLPISVPRETLLELSRLKPWLTLAHILFDWLLIACAIILCERFFNWPLYLVAVCFIAARLHGLAVLAHDATHYRLHPNRFWNDAFGDLFCFWPTLMTVRQYRTTRHFGHHRHIGTVDDPHVTATYGDSDAFAFPKPSRALALILAKTAAHGPISALRATLHSFRIYSSKFALAARLAFYGVVLLAIAYFHAWRLAALYWLIPLTLWMPVLLHYRLISEHFGVAAGVDRRGARTRTTLANWFDFTFVAPHNINYHVEHHLYPSVPFFALPRLHELLMREPSAQQHLHVTRGYWRVWRELTAVKEQ